MIGSAGSGFLSATGTRKFTSAFDAAGVEVVKIPPRAPKAKRLRRTWVCTVRHECLDWTLIWNPRQLHQVLTEYLAHYNRVRLHRASTFTHPARPIAVIGPAPEPADVYRIDVLSSLIHEYQRAA
jgi:hypothetical protein